MSLVVNVDKTRYMLSTCRRIKRIEFQITANNYTFDIVSKLVYSGSAFTYIIDHYNSSVRIIDLVSHTTYVACVNFIYKWRDLQFKVGPERQIF